MVFYVTYRGIDVGLPALSQAEHDTLGRLQP